MPLAARKGGGAVFWKPVQLRHSGGANTEYIRRRVCSQPHVAAHPQ
jgi:hypothetical protein